MRRGGLTSREVSGSDSDPSLRVDDSTTENPAAGSSAHEPIAATGCAGIFFVLGAPMFAGMFDMLPVVRGIARGIVAGA